MNIFKIILIGIILSGCVTNQSAQGSLIDQQVLQKLTSSNAICGGEQLDLPDNSFEPKDRSRKTVINYFNCMAKNVPERTQLLHLTRDLWKGIFDKKLSPEHARQAWANFTNYTASVWNSQHKQDKDFGDVVGDYIDYRLSHHSSYSDTSYSNMQQQMNQQQILQNQQQMMFQQRMMQQQQFMNNGGYGG